MFMVMGVDGAFTFLRILLQIKWQKIWRHFIHMKCKEITWYDTNGL